MSRSVDWVEQDLGSGGTIRWRQAKRDSGQYPVEYTDRHLDFTQEQVVKKATKKAPAQVEAVGKYSEADKTKLAATFDPLVAAMKSRYGSFSWWHFDAPTGTLLYGSANQRTQVPATDIIKTADQCMTKFTKLLSTLHGHAIGPER